MNILFLMGIYPSYGGVEKVSTILANEFVKRGHQVSIVSFEQPHLELINKELSSKIKIYKLRYPVFLRNNFVKLKKIINEDGIDILINQWCLPYYVTRLCKIAIKHTKCKLISVHHNRPDTNSKIEGLEMKIKGQKFPIFNQIILKMIIMISKLSLKYAYNNSDAYVILSNSFIPIVEKFLRIKNMGKICVIHNPITVNNEKISLSNKQKEIIYVGRIEYNQKRTFRIIEIWGKIQPLLSDWKLTIVGDGPDRGDLEKRIARDKIEGISIEGFQDPVPYYKNASILLLVSEYEGFPLVLAECMAYGVIPIILGSFPSAYDIIENQVSGLILPYPYSEQSFINKMEDLMRNSSKRYYMAQNAIKSSKRYALDPIIKQWEMLFNQLHNIAKY